jgi:hypothetical protein
MADSVKLMAATAGMSFPADSLKRAVEWRPDVIACQGTSTDPGPEYTATDNSHFLTMAFEPDLAAMISTARDLKIPFISSLGGGGSDDHLERCLKALDRVAARIGPFRLGVVSGEISKDYLRGRLAQGATIPRLEPHPQLSEVLTEDDLDRAVKVVGQMGPEPILELLGEEVDGVVTGRALDSGVLAAFPLFKGIPPEVAFTAGKIMECQSLAATPGTASDILCGEIFPTAVEVFPPNPRLRCTTRSIASHVLYERTNPSEEINPAGVLDMSDAKYEALDDRTVRVSGSVWRPLDYTVKIEGAERLGYRTICIAGIRDSATIGQLDAFVDGVQRSVTDFAVKSGVEAESFSIRILKYGQSGVMGRLEPTPVAGHEVCLIVDVIAAEQEVAHEISSFAKSTLGHYGFPGRRTTANNVAYPFSPMDFDLGKVYRFNIWHSLPLEDPCEPFRAEIMEFPRKGDRPWNQLR